MDSSIWFWCSWRRLVTVQATATDTTDERPVKALQVVPILVDRLVEPSTFDVFSFSSQDKRSGIGITPLDDVGHQIGPLVKGLADVALPSVAGDEVSRYLRDPLRPQQRKRAWQSWVNVRLTMPAQQHRIHIPAWWKRRNRNRRS
jgi:hypothetical protein